jgi:hypothetical protein
VTDVNTKAADYAVDFAGALVEPMRTASRRVPGVQMGATWKREKYPMIIPDAALTKSVDGMLTELFEQFENDWLAANPRRAPRGS